MLCVELLHPADAVPQLLIRMVAGLAELIEEKRFFWLRALDLPARRWRCLPTAGGAHRRRACPPIPGGNQRPPAPAR